jgi:hypothetical protein
MTGTSLHVAMASDFSVARQDYVYQTVQRSNVDIKITDRQIVEKITEIYLTLPDIPPQWLSAPRKGDSQHKLG